MEIKDLPVAGLKRHPMNVRGKADYAKAELADLMGSIKQHGLLEPLVVMPVETKAKEPGHWLILAGHRRHAALAAMEAEHAPCVILDPMADEKAIALLVSENAQHKAPDPIKEAEAVGSLLDATEKEGTSYPYDAVGMMLGKSASWVRGRALLCYLTPAWRKALGKEKTALRELPLTHLSLVAVLDPVQQDAVLEEIERNVEYDGIPTLAQWRSWIGRYTRSLDAVPWSLDEPVAGVDAPACAQCPNRESSQGDLFAGEGLLKKGDVCLRSTCYMAKQQAVVVAKIEEAKAKHGDDLVVSISAHRGVDRDALPETVKVVNHYDRTTLAKAKGGAPTLDVMTGKITYTAPASKSATVGRGGGRPKGAEGKPKPTPPADRRAAHKKRRLVRALTVAKATIEGRARATIGQETKNKKTGAKKDVTTEAPKGAIPSLVSILHAITRLGAHAMGDHRLGRQEPTGEFAMPDEDCGVIDDEVHVRLWGCVRTLLAKDCDVWGSSGVQAVENKAKAVAEVIEGMGLSWDKAFWEPACEALPEPKAWAHMNADGTPKTVPTKEKKPKAHKPGTRRPMPKAKKPKAAKKEKAAPAS